MPEFWGGEVHSGGGEAASELLMSGPAWGWGAGSEEAAGARQAPGRTGTFLSHEHSLQASNCCLP